jgi:glycerophosphoryl diester phosphodiesterase
MGVTSMKNLTLIVSVFLAIFIRGTLKTAGDVGAQASAPWQSEKCYVIGHRGGAGLAPENTLAAFAGAFSLDADAVEMDVHLTADGEVVVYHDSKLKPEITRTADGQWLKEPGPAIRNLSLKELRSYDVGRVKPGTGYAWRYPNQKPADGQRIPTLGEIFALAKKKGNTTVQFWIEIKTSPLEPELTSSPETVADAVIAVIRKAGLADRAVLLSFDWRSLVHTRKVAPEVTTAYLSRQSGSKDTIQVGRPDTSPWTAGLDVDDFGSSVPRTIHTAHGHYWLPHYKDIDQKQLKEAHDLGLKVIVWTVNQRATMRYLIDLGVDGIITDRPDVLKEVLGEVKQGGGNV